MKLVREHIDFKRGQEPKDSMGTGLIIPQFPPFRPFLLHSSPPPLVNSYYDVKTRISGTGKWNPSEVDTSSVGSKPYTFTPDDWTVARPVTINIDVATADMINKETLDKIKAIPDSYENKNIVLDYFYLHSHLIDSFPQYFDSPIVSINPPELQYPYYNEFWFAKDSDWNQLFLSVDLELTPDQKLEIKNWFKTNAPNFKFKAVAKIWYRATWIGPAIKFQHKSLI